LKPRSKQGSENRAEVQGSKNEPEQIAASKPVTELIIEPESVIIAPTITSAKQLGHYRDSIQRPRKSIYFIFLGSTRLESKEELEKVCLRKQKKECSFKKLIGNC
jgi:hypothetical protein